MVSGALDARRLDELMDTVEREIKSLKRGAHNVRRKSAAQESAAGGGVHLPPPESKRTSRKMELRLPNFNGEVD